MSFGQTTMYGMKQMRVMKFIIQETGTYNQQWKRPFVSGLNHKTFNTIVEKSMGSKEVLATNLTGVASQFLHPSAQPESHLYIPNGWNERRLRFFLELQIEEQMGCVITEYVVGYTDYAGVSLNNQLDPQMRFFINGINATRYMSHVTPLGNQLYQNSIDASHVLINNQYSSVQAGTNSFIMRPEDIYLQMDTADIQVSEGLSDFLDTQTLLTSIPVKSRRTNAIAPVYVSSIIDSYLKIKPSEGITDTREELLHRASGLNSSNSVSEDPFMAMLRSKYNGNGDSFCYGDLLGIDNNVIHTTKVLPLTTTTRATLHQTGLTSDWAAADNETVFATCVSQSLPGYMLDYCVNLIHIQATNRDFGGKLSIQVIDVKSFMQNVDITSYVKSVLFKVEHELLRDLSFNGQMDFAIDVKCDLLGETWINLSLNSGPFVMYVTPSFCDALMTPMVTSNYSNSVGIANDFSNILSQISDSKPNMSVMANYNLGNI